MSPPPTETHPENGSISSADDKSHTFRKRRLSLTNLRQYGEEQEEKILPEVQATPSPEANGDATSTFRKRRLSVTHKEQPEEEPYQRHRRASDASQSSIESYNRAKPQPPKRRRLKSRTVHAAELLAHPPPSPSVHQLYQFKTAPPQRPSIDLEWSTDQPAPKWRKRHTRHLHEDETTLPFPRDIVGTFSCHGVEPIYEEDYVVDDDEWLVGNKMTPPDKNDSPSLQPSESDKPTAAAKINQDRGGVAFPYGNCAQTALFAVYDGHGQGGESVAQFALHEVQRRLEKHKQFTSDIEQAFKDTFLSVDESLKQEALIEPLYAGTTACVALLRDRKLALANAGDSRAVLAQRTKDQSYTAIDLTKDQNPDLPEEQARIEQAGGFVSPPPEPGLSARVWLDPDCTQIGLAMARSVGDHAVKEIGVIAEPVVSFHDIVPEDEFVIFATDGVWEFVSSEEAVTVVAKNLNRGATRACQALIETAAAKWHDEEGDYRDDITALVVRLPQLWQKLDHEDSKTNAKQGETEGENKVL